MEKKICGDVGLITVFRKASRHNTVLRGMGEQIAWCSDKGCFQAFRENAVNNCVEIGITTGDWNDAVRDLKEQLDKLDKLREQALNGGENELENYIANKKAIKKLIEHYDTLLIQLELEV